MGNDNKTMQTYWWLGSNQIIKNEKFSIAAEDWFQVIEKNYPALEAKYFRLEPTKTRTIEQKTEAFASVRGRWLRIVEVVRTGFMYVDKYIYIPVLQN